MMEKWFDFSPDNFIIALAATKVLSGVWTEVDTGLLSERMRPLGYPGGSE
jgi:hypothetical protein